MIAGKVGTPILQNAHEPPLPGAAAVVRASPPLPPARGDTAARTALAPAEMPLGVHRDQVIAAAEAAALNSPTTLELKGLLR